MTIKGLIGVVHLGPMPGDPLALGQGFADMEKRAHEDAAALIGGGADGFIVENFGSAPFPKGTSGERTPPHQVAAMAILTRKLLREHGPAVVGVNCLRNDVDSALGIAAAAGASFVRVNVHTGAMLTDQGIIQGEAHRTLRYRTSLVTDVQILADVLVKHAAPLAPLDMQEAVREAIQRGLADGVIVTGQATGGPIDSALLKEARGALAHWGDHALLLGSGVTPQNAPDLAPLADGAIVGTWLKQNGEVSAPVDEERVKRLAGVLGGLFKDR